MAEQCPDIYYYTGLELSEDDNVKFFTVDEDTNTTPSLGKIIKDNYDYTYIIEDENGVQRVVDESLIILLSTNHVARDWLALGLCFYYCLTQYMPYIPFDRLEPRRITSNKIASHRLSSTELGRTRVCLDEKLVSLLHILLCENEEEEIFHRIMEILA